MTDKFANSMWREIEQTLKDMYNSGYRDALKEGTLNLNIPNIRAKIGSINGMNETMVNQIVDIIINNSSKR